MKGPFFVCQITDSCVKVLSCLAEDGKRGEFKAVDCQVFPAGLSDEELSGKLVESLRKAGYKNSPLIVSLPRSKATCRQLKIPAQSPNEIEKIVSLQASRYLPYPIEELVTASQVLTVSPDGYANINLMIVHKDVISRYLKIFQDLKVPSFSIALSSYGLNFLYECVSPGGNKPVVFLDCDAADCEVVVIQGDQMLFSRFFRLPSRMAGWENQCAVEIKKSLEAYYKEASKEVPEQIVYMSGAQFSGISAALKNELNIPVKEIDFFQKLELSQSIKDSAAGVAHSFLSLIGFALRDLPDSLNLLPRRIKEQTARAFVEKERKTTMLFVLATVLIFSFGISRHLDNKTRYLGRLKEELNKISKEAAPLEGIEKRFRLVSLDAARRNTGLDCIRELNKIVPANIKLTEFSYEDEGSLILNGQASELNAVFSFAGMLEKSSVFSGYKTKIRFATQRNRSGELVDFEIDCLRKNAKNTE